MNSDSFCPRRAAARLMIAFMSEDARIWMISSLRLSVRLVAGAIVRLLKDPVSTLVLTLSIHSLTSIQSPAALLSREKGEMNCDIGTSVNAFWTLNHVSEPVTFADRHSRGTRWIFISHTPPRRGG